ncbi:hypothetical protein A2763_00960 [Candidatus Kaiserbacteria bacterium RIFCSPHIGHO2_01_FULL_54_36]|uniref:Uncharacterized protein n=1 Tax=Candidatus Kaiserbacteria bacterium RIFCSPHIGHO2_01_FULL_54_36 TaxID=1798482 RepID=A0A1F6CJT6_9BACT|nr:MAG: hypothetical protein A2763_00960 [Candidatus Kaiserbacteria bacterium RIFCSPHIGHO2_01_FULL_54_36]OGG75275.1 MAG: hypothetical protein A3A41_03200 [Candidatus Kaiserbacteria bacterium RIFCSPLOWO2_01_FULL_54_22]
MAWVRDNWLKVLAILLVLGALTDVPYYAYYQLMNWVVVGAALVTAWQAYKLNKDWLMWLFVLVAVVFNPLAPFYFSADMWRIADVIVAILFLASFFLIKPKN